MCGIIGFLDKSGRGDAPVGQIMLKMLDALCRRGPDSAGVALFGPAQTDDLVLRVKLGEHGDFRVKGHRVAEKVGGFAQVREVEVPGEYLKIRLNWDKRARELEREIEAVDPSLEVVSLGKHMQIVKQVGSPKNLNNVYHIDSFVGTHAIGHTRMSTESRVDLSHSQPFWAHGIPDLATVHNGHITNYHKLRRCYEQRGFRFYTENDSEVIGVYLADQIEHGSTLESALTKSLTDFDGSYCYLAASAEGLAYVKDRFAFKPLVVAENDEMVAIATEEVAIRAAFPKGDYVSREAPANHARTWELLQQLVAR